MRLLAFPSSTVVPGGPGGPCGPDRPGLPSDPLFPAGPSAPGGPGWPGRMETGQLHAKQYSRQPNSKGPCADLKGGTLSFALPGLHIVQYVQCTTGWP